jgi:Secretion system C-terminal sorting domain
MKNLILFLFGVFSSITLLAQANYTYTSGTDTYTSIASGTLVHASGTNEVMSANIAIGFTFRVGCNDYTQMQICTEGWIGFGGGMTTSSNNDLAGSTQRPIIAPLWDDIRVSNSGYVRYELSGTSPNRVMTIEYNGMRWNDGAGANNGVRVISAIVKLYETSNIVDFVYQQESSSPSGASASIGIALPVSGQFISIDNAGASSTVTEASVTTRPATGTRYRFTPPAACSGTPTAGSASSSLSSVCAPTSINLTEIGGSSGCGITYQWQSSPDASSWSNIAGATSASHTITSSGNIYYRLVYTCTSSGLSANSNAVFVSGGTCSGVPSPGTLTPSTFTTTCAVATVNFTIAGGTSCGVTYQWQYSPNNVTFTNLMGATGASLTANILTTGYYRRTITCTSSGLSDNSNAVLITNSGVAPANDLPCYAQALILGVPASGSNVCSNNAFEPATPPCWVAGNVNTVWYSVVAPASGRLRMKTITQSSPAVLQRTQMAFFTGTCSNLTQFFCNVDPVACGSYIPKNSEIYYTGLTAGQTYYISVDGEASDVGDFSILVIDGLLNFPTVPGQDCGLPFTLCNPTTTIGNPGYQAIGGLCDQDGSTNCTSGEANSVWYTININPTLPVATQLTFDIVPNDYGNPNPITGQANPGYSAAGDETDYDFLLYNVSAPGGTTCAAIATGAATTACNFSSLGVTGCSAAGNAPAAYPGFDGAYETGPMVTAGQSYLLVIQNFSNSTSGFTVQLPLGSPAVYTPPTTVYWTGGNFNNDFTSAANWGGCNSPVCGVTAFVASSSANQPILPSGTYSVNDLSIGAGAVLTLQSGAILQICGNFTNNGSLVCQPGSTIEFVGTGTQTLTGSFENSDAFFNFTVNKLTGTVLLANNIDVDGNFLTSNNTSILNTAGLRVRVGGNFTNAQGNTTFSNTGTTGTLGFIGTGARTYTQGSTQLDLNFVTMGKTSGGTVTLTTNMFIKAATGTLTLTDGKFITGANRIDVANNAPTAVSTGNVNSYVVGNLYRAINGLGSYDFPVGTTSLYERANINFTAATTINTLQARFDTWPSGPNTLGLTDCGGTGNFILPSQNMGYWTINASNTPTSGTYNVTLYSTGATNTAGATGWTVQKAASVAGPWGLNGTCALSTVSVIQRTGLSGFSVFGVAQSTTPLPIELLDFTGYRFNGKNILKWTTVSELKSAYFNLERSKNGKDFEFLEKIIAQGNSNTPFDYATEDKAPYRGITYYRLNFFDEDGSSEYSKTIAISDEVTKDLKIASIFPNPGSSELNIDFSVSKETTVLFSLADGSGRSLIEASYEAKGVGTYTINTDSLAPGVYILVITTEDGFKENYNWVKK